MIISCRGALFRAPPKRTSVRSAIGGPRENDRAPFPPAGPALSGHIGRGIRVSRPASAGAFMGGVARRRDGKTKNPPERRLGRVRSSRISFRLGDISPVSRTRDRERPAAVLRSVDPSVQGQHVQTHDLVAHVDVREGRSSMRARVASQSRICAIDATARRKVWPATHSPRSAMSSRWIISARPA
jgi:hypothetical protein